MKGFSLLHLCAVTCFVSAFCHMVESKDLDWIQNCPKTCTCQVSHFLDLSISKSLSEIEKKPMKEYFENFKRNDDILQFNSVIDNNEEEPKAASNLKEPNLNMAMCVLQEGVTVDDFFTAIPLEVQVLTVLQGPEKAPISIETTHLTKFNDLQVFEIFGYRGEKPLEGGNQTKLLFKVDFPDPVPNLRYLHLDKAQLKENSEVDNNIDVNDVGNENFNGQVDTENMGEMHSWEKYDMEKNEKNTKNGPQWKEHDNLVRQPQEHISSHRNKREIINSMTEAKLVFIKPPNEIIPYEIYKKMQEKKRAVMFAGFKNLKYLQITNSDLKDIDWQWFDDLKTLEILSLENNRIEYIPDFTFHALKNLRILVLSNNNIQSLISTSFAGLFSLEVLDLSQNNLMELSDISFPPFPKLNAIDLSDNPIKFVRGNTFEVMNNTQKLYLGGENRNMKIQTNAFTGLSTLRSLQISGVRLHILERDFFQGMPDLQHLRLQGKIDYLAFDAFAEIPLIKAIILRNCSILALSMDTFYGLYNLEIIDLSNNNLKKLPPKLFDQQSLLKEVILSGNQLTDIPAKLFFGLSPKLIHLHNNPWLCSCKMKRWNVLPINQVKRKKEKACKYYADKGSNCILNRENEYEYVYSRTVEPQCFLPSKFRGWTISKVLRKGLNCIDSLIKEKSIKKLNINLKNDQKYEYIREQYGSKLMPTSSANDGISNNVESE